MLTKIKILREDESWRAQLSQIIERLIPYMGITVIFLLFALTTDGKFIAIRNLKTILNQSVITMIAAIGATFVMAGGGLDFSLGGVLALAALIGYYAGTINAWLTIPACIISGIVLSSIIGYLTSKLHVPAFIAGMCVMFFGKGAVQIQATVHPNNFVATELLALDKNWFLFGVAGVVIIAAYILMEKTKIGRYNRACGANTNTAVLSGVDNGKYMRFAYLVVGTCMGICALLTLIRTGGVNPNTGNSLEVNCVIATVLGGAVITGGSRVKIQNAVFGVLTFFMLTNGLSLWGVNPLWINTIKSVVFFVCVILVRDKSNTEIPK